jgi:CRP-like cAMP-binding protein
MSVRTDAESMATRVAWHPFLAGMNQKELALVADCAMAVTFKKGKEIFREGERANCCCLIETGQVALESTDYVGNPVVIDTIGAGDLLGWSWMFPPYTWHFTARAVEQTTAIFFPGTILRQYCEKNHSLGYELLKRMTAVMNRRWEAARAKWSGVNQRVGELVT